MSWKRFDRFAFTSRVSLNCAAQLRRFFKNGIFWDVLGLPQAYLIVKEQRAPDCGCGLGASSTTPEALRKTVLGRATLFARSALARENRRKYLFLQVNYLVRALRSPTPCIS